MVLRAFANGISGIAYRRFLHPSQHHLSEVYEGINTPHIWTAWLGLQDLDMNLHMNNSSYLYCTELARWHLSGRIGLLELALKNKWVFMVGSQAIRYRHAIAPFSRYQIQTQIEAIDERWLYITQTFMTAKNKSKLKIFAQATVRAIILSTCGRKIQPRHVLEQLRIPSDVILQLYSNDIMHLERAGVKGLLMWDKRIEIEMKTKAGVY